MVAAVTQHMYHPDDPPALQLAQAIAGIGASDAEGGGDLLGVHWPGRMVEPSMDLGDGPVDPSVFPSRPSGE